MLQKQGCPFSLNLIVIFESLGFQRLPALCLLGPLNWRVASLLFGLDHCLGRVLASLTNGLRELSCFERFEGDTRGLKVNFTAGFMAFGQSWALGSSFSFRKKGRGGLFLFTQQQLWELRFLPSLMLTLQIRCLGSCKWQLMGVRTLLRTMNLQRKTHTAFNGVRMAWQRRSLGRIS